MNTFDLVVIGAGPGGYVAAIRAAQRGLRTAVVERGHLGGCCLNRGCVPTKSFLTAAQLYREMLHAADYGLSAADVSFDLEKLYENKNSTVETLRRGIEQLFKANGVRLFRGHGVITARDRVLVRGEEETALSAGRILIATGGRAALLPEALQGIEGVYTSDDLLAERPPKPFRRLLILGAGVIGVEFASLYNALGCEVTLVSKYEKPLRRLDKEISQNLAMLMKKRGIAIRNAPTLTGLEKTEDGLVCRFVEREAEQSVACDAVLVAIGWRSDTAGLFAGYDEVLFDAAGGIAVNENFQTSVERIYAIGDCTSVSRLAHAASAQGLNAVSHMLGETPAMDLNTIPSCVYTDPEIAVVGLSADEAAEAGISVKVGKYLMAGNARSMIARQERGFIKVVADAESGRVVGAQLMCARATDIVGELCTAISGGLSAERLMRVVRAHPTFAEGVSEAVEDLEDMAVHIAPRGKRAPGLK